MCSHTSGDNDEATQNAVGLVVENHPSFLKIRCYMHSLNLLLKDMGKSDPIASALSTVDKVLAAFTSSGVLRQRLKDLQSMLDPNRAPLRLIRPVDTMFNNKFDSLGRVLVLRKAIETALGTESPTAQEFTRMGLAMDLMKPNVTAMNEVQKDTTALISAGEALQLVRSYFQYECLLAAFLVLFWG